MDYWVHTAGRYIATSVLGRVHAVFFNCHRFDAMTCMLDEIVLARMMTAIDLEFKKAMHYHDEGYESDNNYGLPSQVMRPVHIYLVYMTKASFIQLNTRKHSTLSPPSCSDDPEACPSVKGSASTLCSMRQPHQHKQ